MTDIFNQPVKEAVIHAALNWLQASQRQGTHSTKTRAEVRGGGKKPWKQKGTGRARAGSIRSPLWRKGGIVFGPKPRDYSYNLPKKIRRLAIKMALSDKHAGGKVKIVDELKVAQAKTKEATALLKKLEVVGKVLLVLGEKNEIFEKAARNIEGVTLVIAQAITVFDVLYADWIVLEKSAVKKLEEVLA